MDTIALNFSQLKRAVHAQLAEQGGTALRGWPNLQSALTGFMHERGLKDDEAVGSHLRASYYANLTKHVEALRSAGEKSPYISNRKSLLKQWRSRLIELDRANAIARQRATPFQVALLDLFEQTGSKLKTVCRATGVPLPTLKRWREGALPTRRSVRWARQLESHFGLPTGALTDLLPNQRGHECANRAARPTIAYRERLRRAHAGPRYAVTQPTEKLKREWSRYLEYKVAASEDEMNGLRRSRVGQWKVDKRRLTATPPRWFASYLGKNVPTASVLWSFAAQYLGWLELDSTHGGAGLPREDAHTLANFACKEYVKRYVDWRLSRSNTIFHDGIVKILQFVKALTHPETGYLTQCYGRFNDTSDNDGPARWAAACEQAFKFAKQRLAERENSRHSVDEAEEDHQRLNLVGGFAETIEQVSRNSFEPIARTLALANPLLGLADAVKRLAATRPSTGGVLEAIWARDMLLLKLFASNPLRVKNMRELTYSQDGHGKLRKVDGEWQIFIPRGEFKNFKGAAKRRSYLMPVAKEVWPDIERYLGGFRSMLAAPENPYVFVSSKNPGGHFDSLDNRVFALLRQYLEGCPGAGPHAFRHIVATTILKQNPNAWTLAALVLHDEEETVRKHYAHLRGDDAHRLLREQMASVFTQFG